MLQVDIVTAKGTYTEKDAATAVRTMLEVGEGRQQGSIRTESVPCWRPLVATAVC